MVCSRTLQAGLDILTEFHLDVGLDTVAFIENHYVEERKLSREKTVNFLQQNYLDRSKLGKKSDKGGLYSPESKLAVLI